jgi:1,4-alpha-glucan branching enzyme
MGDRVEELAPQSALEAALAVTLLAPGPPLLFMGEEWGSRQPFPFFCDFSGDLAEAVRKGRKSEFKEAYEKLGDEWPDPLAEDTFRAAVLDWAAREREPHRSRLDLVRRLLRVRMSEVVPRLAGMTGGGGKAQDEKGVLRAEWPVRGGTLRLFANLTPNPMARPQELKGRVIWGGAPAAQLAPWSVYWAIGES